MKNPKILKRAEGVWRKHMERAITDPADARAAHAELRAGLQARAAVERLLSGARQANVSLVTEKIIEFRPDAVVTADGAEHPVDTVILATGFHVTDNPMFATIAGTDGRTLADAFGETYLGTVVPGFPNYFQLTGANTGLGPFLDAAA